MEITLEEHIHSLEQEEELGMGSRQEDILQEQRQLPSKIFQTSHKHGAYSDNQCLVCGRAFCQFYDVYINAEHSQYVCILLRRGGELCCWLLCVIDVGRG